MIRLSHAIRKEIRSTCNLYDSITNAITQNMEFALTIDDTIITLFNNIKYSNFIETIGMKDDLLKYRNQCDLYRVKLNNMYQTLARLPEQMAEVKAKDINTDTYNKVMDDITNILLNTATALELENKDMLTCAVIVKGILCKLSTDTSDDYLSALIERLNI